MPKVLVFLILALPLVGAYALYATGIVAIYRASRVLNLAHGAMATVPAYLFHTMVTSWGVPLAPSLILGVAAGATLGILIERVFVRRLRSIGATAQTVGTVAAFGLTIALSAKIWGAGGVTAPTVFPEGHVNVGASLLRYGQIGLFVVAIAMSGLLWLLLQRTWFGLAMRGAAVNRRAASLMGVDPDLTTAAAWALGGGLAAMAGILLAAVTVLQPYSLSLSVLPAFVAALMGGLESLPGALLGSAVVGVVIGFVPVLADLPVLRVVLAQVGGPELALALTAMVVMAARGQRLVGSDVRAEFAAARVPRPRRSGRRLISPRVALILLLGWIWLPGTFTLLGDANLALVFTMIAVSLVVLTGWVGQISLAQGAFVGVGAFSSILLTKRLGIPFPFNLPLAGAIAAGVAAALGVVSLRVRGLYLAVATLIFGWMADSYLFSSPWFVGAGGSATGKVEPIGTPGGYPYFAFGDRRTFYLVALAGAATSLILAANLRRSKTGRAFFAIRGSEVAAASLGIDVTRYKLAAFALSGFIAGVAGNLIATNRETIISAEFALTASLFFLSIAVVGGLQSLEGAVGSALLFSGLNEVFFRVDALRGWLDVVSAGLLTAVLLFYPGGLSALPDALRRLSERRGARARGRAGVAGDRLAAGIRTTARRLGSEVAGAGREIGVAWNATLARGERASPRFAPLLRMLRTEMRGIRAEGRAVRLAAAAARDRIEEINARPILPAGRERPIGVADALASLGAGGGAAPIAARREMREPVLEADAVTVRFGGLVAVDGAALTVRRGEIVGLIGPNGAGKTTLFNAIAGFVAPEQGRVRLHGEDVTSLAVHERAARGIGRTFQVLQLAPDLTVHDNLLVATHTRNDSGFLSHLIVTQRSAAAEFEARARVERVVALLGLEEVLHRPVAGLPFGTLRMVELGRALVTGSPVVMLDEPASGLDSVETERFAEILRYVRETLGVSLLLIEHDVHLVMSISDYVYVLDRGRPIADGSPAVVQRDPAVLAAYLGGAPAEEPVPAAVVG